METAAQMAARELPDGRGPGGASQSRGDRGYAIFGVLFLMAIPVVLAGFTLTLPWGWATVLAAVALCTITRLLWSRLAPGQVAAAVAVDPEGVVRMLAGRSMISAHRKMFTSGPRPWFLRGFGLGLLIVVLAIAIMVVGIIVLPEKISFLPFLVVLIAGMLGFAAFVYNSAVRPLRAARKGYRIVQPGLVMPLLGLYAKRYGDAAATIGVPADALLATARDASPEETAAIAEQVLVAEFMRRLSGSWAPGV